MEESPPESSVSTETARVRGQLRRVRVVAVLLAVGAVVPWSVQVFTARDATWLFAWGLVNTNPLQVTTLVDFLFVYTQGLPAFILAWPASVVCYLLVLGSALLGLWIDWEDPRVTAGLLVLAGIAQLSVAQGFSYQPNRTAYPLGTAVLWAVAWWGYWPRVKNRIGW
ncbi:TIGR04206 family protein [Salinirubrum litoreum]|uniref:TIGR04206 family protein n=1 Tax=Salinirubrum litoreum TaxID=1126234 RepID=A0ABD5R6F9_9EURY|nr:TIGR04206 family protein [Salinirubrum litoreum]